MGFHLFLPTGPELGAKEHDEAMEKRSTQLAVVQRGRPITHTERWQKTTVAMLERHAAYLDLMSVLIRLRRHKAVSRAEIIRALIEFMIRSKIDFARFATVDEMVTFLVSRFRRVPNSGRWPLLLEPSLFDPQHAAVAEEHEAHDG
jgi:hypothetical protein